MAGSAARTTSPPSPPSPPSGPPYGTCFSRRKLTQPAPPSPPLTKISISSTNIAGPGTPASASGGGGEDAHVTRITPAMEANLASDPGIERVVRALPDVDPGLEPRAALADEDAAPGDELTVESLHPEHLGVGIATVARAADALFVCHGP